MALKPLTDEEIQAMLEDMSRQATAMPEDHETLQAYKQLFDELASEPPLDLSFGFSGKVIRQIQQQEATHYQRRAYLYFGLTVGLVLVISVGFQAFWSAHDVVETWQAISFFKWPILFVISMVALIQWADYQFIKAKVTEFTKTNKTHENT